MNLERFLECMGDSKDKRYLLKDIGQTGTETFSSNYIKDIEELMDPIEYSHCYMVWDRKIEDYIFWKECSTYNAYIDLLHNRERDLRTKTDKVKRGV